MVKKPLRVFPIRLEEDLYKKLRKLSYLNEIPIAQIIREAIEIKLEANKKVLTNSDIAIY